MDTRQPELTERLVSSADGRLLAIVTPQGTLRVLDAGTGKVVRELTGASGDLHALAFSPDGNRVAAADYSSVLVWPTHGSGRPERHEVHGGRVGAGEWSPDGATLATLGRDGAVVVLDTTGRRHVGAVLTEALSRTTTLWATRDAVVAGQVDGRLLFVDPASGDVQVASERPHGTKAIDSARTGRTGDLLVTVDYQGGTGVWDLRTRRYLGGIDLPGDWEVFETGAWVSPDGRSAATIHDWSGPVIFDVAARRVVRQLPPLPAPPSGAAQAPLEIGVEGWTPDGRSILITRTLSTTTSDLLVVDATTGAVRLRVDTKDSLPQEVVADPKGRYLVVGTSTGSLLVLDAEDGHLLAPPLQANEGAVANVSVSPDGRYIAASGQPPRLTVWDTRTFRQVAVPLPLDLNAVDARARFAPDGRLVVATGRVLRAFVVDPAQWLARACREAGRVLTREEFEEVLPGPALHARLRVTPSATADRQGVARTRWTGRPRARTASRRPPTPHARRAGSARPRERRPRRSPAAPRRRRTRRRPTCTRSAHGPDVDAARLTEVEQHRRASCRRVNTRSGPSAVTRSRSGMRRPSSGCPSPRS